jgi:hypothetical protein
MADRERRSGAGPRPEPELLADGPTLNVERCPGTGANDLPRHHISAPNWTVLERMSAGRWDVLSRRTSCRGSTRGLREGGGESVSCAIASTDAVATGAMDEAAKHSEELIHTYSENGILLTGALVHPREDA